MFPDVDEGMNISEGEEEGGCLSKDIKTKGRLQQCDMKDRNDE